MQPFKEALQGIHIKPGDLIYEHEGDSIIR